MSDSNVTFENDFLKNKEIKIIIKQIILNFKFMFKDKVNISLILSVTFCALLIPVIFIPLSNGAGLTYTMVSFGICAVSFSSIYFNVRKSTLYKNIKLTKSNRWTFNISTLLSIVILNVIVTCVVFASLTFFSQIDIVLEGWLSYTSHAEEINNSYYMTNFDSFLLINYATFTIALGTYFVSFVFVYLISDQKTYFVLCVCILIWIIIFGGTFNDYFNVPNKSSGLVMQNAVSPLFPWTLYEVGLFNPFFSASNIISNIYSVNRVTFRSSMEWVSTAWYTQGGGTLFKLMFFNKGNTLAWKVQLWFPWVEIVCLFITGVILSKIKRN